MQPETDLCTLEQNCVGSVSYFYFHVVCSMVLFSNELNNKKKYTSKLSQ